MLAQVQDFVAAEQLRSLADDVTQAAFLSVSRVASCGKQPLTFPRFTLSPSPLAAEERNMFHSPTWLDLRLQYIREK